MLQHMSKATQDLADWLRRVGKTRTAFAREVGLTKPKFSRLMQGHQRPDIATAAKIEAATGGFINVKDWLAPAKETA